MKHVTRACLIALLACAGDGQAGAQSFTSSYTSTAPKDCRVRSAGNGVDDSTIRVCPGKAGLVVLISEDDLREVVSVGKNRSAAAKEPAAEVWFGPFNSSEHTVEWPAAAKGRLGRPAVEARLSHAGGDRREIALIAASRR